MTVVDFQTEALGRLRARVAQLGEANSDLVAFARSHTGAVQQIHAAALAAMDADSFDHLVHVILDDWVDILRVDAIGLGLVGHRPANGGTRVVAVDAVQVDLWRHLLPLGQLRTVRQGATLFGPVAPLVRAEALIAVDPAAASPGGMLALGSRQPHAFGDHYSGELLGFLGRVVSRMIARWMPHPS
jgi:hypothetical protein